MRGVAVCQALSRDLALHLVRPGERAAAPVRAQYELGSLGSKRVRQPGEREAIRSASALTAVFELQGELGFMAAEAISRRMTDVETQPELVILDLRRVARADRGGIDFLQALGRALDEAGGALVLSGVADDLELELELSETLLVFDDLDRALEWCEDELLGRLGHPSPPTAVAPADHELLSSLDPGELEQLLPLLGVLAFTAGTIVVSAGEEAEDVFLVTRGSLSVFAPGAGPRSRRFSTVSAGMTFGELGYVERGRRTADVLADTDIECLTLPFAVLDRLAMTEPQLYAKLLHGFARVLVSSLRVANAEVAQLSR